MYSEDNGIGKSDDQLGVDETKNSVTLSSVDYSGTAFTIEQEHKYARKYDEGFGLPDKQYEMWLRINHPD